ncbi:MAG: hypothetical protein JO372_14680 [Solirubrobacterales bacterium]|nr:hypothetical protein [Solirubrobacterales bacterium]
MDGAHSQFLILVGDICLAGALAKLWVEVRTDGGIRLSGTPASIGVSHGDDEVDETGYEQMLYIGDGAVNLDEIVECTIRLKATGEPRARQPDPA